MAGTATTGALSRLLPPSWLLGTVRPLRRPDQAVRRAKRPNRVNAAPQGSMNPGFDHAKEDLWVFAYGSPIWRAGFEHLERVPARLIGAHRALCVYSFVHRGTPERPGLVLGLDHGGMCRGMAYRVTVAKRPATLRYLRDREQVTKVYLERVRSVVLIDHPAERVQAVCYLVDRSHVQYAGKLSLDDQLRIVRHGHGKSGANRDYVLATVRALEAMGCRDRELHLLAERLHGLHEAHGEEVHPGTG